MAKKAPAKKQSLRDRMANRHKQIDQASGYGTKKKVAKKKATRKKK